MIAGSMLIAVHVAPNAKQPRVIRVSDGHHEVWIDVRAGGWPSYQRLVEIMAEHFKTRKSRIVIVKGTTTRTKTMQVNVE
jgi:uncharacterized protein YggU (UPF0235/DUF167 family)